MIRWGFALALALLGAAGSRAQTTDCATAYEVAQARYVERAFSAVVSSLAPCLDGSRATIPAYRLVALSELRQGQIVQAKLTVLRMLTLSPSYRPDRIQDPPTYVALVETVRDEIAAFSQAELEAAVAAQGPWDRVGTRGPHFGATPPPSAPPVSPPPPGDLTAPRRWLSLSFRAWGGTSSYGGERGKDASSALGEFSDNAGLSGGLGVEIGLTPVLGAYVDAEAGHFPTLPTRKGSNEQFDEIESASAFAQFLTVGARVRPLTSGAVSVLAEAGGGLAFGRRNGSLQAGGAFTVGGGLEVDVSRANRLFATGHATFVGPARAIDGAALPSDPLDLFSGIRLGVRTRL